MTFVIEKIAFMVGNRPPAPDLWPAFAEAHAVIGDRRHRLFLAADGRVTAPTIDNPDLLRAVATEFRQATLAALTAACQPQTDREKVL